MNDNQGRKNLLLLFYVSVFVLIGSCALFGVLHGDIGFSDFVLIVTPLSFGTCICVSRLFVS